MLAGASGRVVEIGAGNGMKFCHYPLVDAAIDVARRQGAADMSLGTGEDDIAARALYESLGFSNRESDGALNFFHEREL